MPLSPFTRALSAALLAFMLGACGGSSGDSAASTAASTTGAAGNVAETALIQSEPTAPRLTGNTAADGLNWFNFRRGQIGLQILARNGFVESAAQGHSEYQKANNTITHTQTLGKPGFTGVSLGDRLQKADFRFLSPSYAYGEVISSMGNTSGFAAAEDLITAIYHRFVVFEPMFKEAGSGAASISGGYTYFTTNLVVDNLDRGLGKANFVTYPYANQTNVVTLFNSDYEAPDPVAGINAVGFPVSVHADLSSLLRVQTFTITPRGGVAMQTVLLSAVTDAKNTPNSAASIIPLEVLAPATTYDVSFTGTVDNVAVSRAWSFTTK